MDVQPFVWCALERSIVEIEPVNINYGSVQRVAPKAEAPFREPRALSRGYREFLL